MRLSAASFSFLCLVSCTALLRAQDMPQDQSLAPSPDQAPPQQQQQPQGPQVADGIAAVVNNDVITISEVRELTGARERSMREMYTGAELDAKLTEMRTGAIKDLIDRQLILEEFKKLEAKGASIPDYVIDDEIQKIIRDDFGGDRASFVRTLRAEGYSLTRFKQVQREKIIVGAMRQEKVNEDFVISPIMIQKYYDQNKTTSFSTPEQVKLRMIVLREDSGSDIVPGGSKKQTADEIRQKLKDGADFNHMAQMYSEDDSTRDAGGDWGWIERNTLNEQLSSVAFGLKPGEVSQVVQVGNTYYILMVEQRKEASVKPIADVHDEIERNLIQQEKMKVQDRWLQSLRQKAFIRIFS